MTRNMNMEFFCRSCEHTFRSEPTVLQYNHPLYGPCSKNVAVCPLCGGESSEKIKPKQTKSRDSAPSCGNSSSCGSCCNML